MKLLVFSGLLATIALPAWAEFPVVEAAKIAERTASVTIRHPDTGWDHYADGWEVFTPDGTSLGVRVLAHPHVNEQPFTRSLSNVLVPEGVTELVIRTRCSRDGWSDQTYSLSLD